MAIYNTHKETITEKNISAQMASLVIEGI